MKVYVVCMEQKMVHGFAYFAHTVVCTLHTVGGDEIELTNNLNKCESPIQSHLHTGVWIGC